MRHLLLLSLVSLGCAATPSTTTPPHSTVHAAPRPLTQERVNALIGEVATLRGLPPRTTVPIYLVDEPTFVSALRELIQRHSDQDEHDAENAFVRGFHLGQQSPNAGRTSSTREVLEEQVVAFYDHERHYVVARNAAPRTQAEAEKQLGTLAHEIEHALQDQHFPRADIEKISGLDEALAYRAVLEGDAMLAMLAFQAADNGIPFSRAVRRLSDIVRTVPIDQFVQSERGTALQAALPLIRERLLFPYHAGAGMVADVYRAGGLSLVNGLFSNRPKSTEQVLHPEKYIAGDQPVFVKMPNVPDGYRAVSSDTLGELQIRVLLSQCVPTELAQRAADGWGGDRYTLLAGKDDNIALLWSTVWDSEADTVEFVQALSVNPSCLGGALTISTEGKNVAITRGLEQTIAKETTKSLLVSPADKPPPVPVGPYTIPFDSRPTPEKGVLWGQTYTSRWLGITSLVPPGFVGQIGNGSTEVRFSLPGYGVSSALLVSDKMTVPRFVEELFQDIAQGYYEAAGGQPLLPIAGGSVSSPLGPAVDRWWFVTNTSTTIRTMILPVCNGTGAYVFLQSWQDPSSKAMLDAWMSSFRWISPAPPICEALNPR